ncbi:MAG: signal recognition particle-docking protein FtsY, partial [Ruminococcaceae bacterium]|nr:signal recognition particle-docking protein FtsY [Oscillospiraceae bacterium]
MGLFAKIKAGLKKTREEMSNSVHRMLHSFTKIDEELFEELEELLVMGDVGISTSEHICDELRRKVKERGIKDPNAIFDLLQETVSEMLSGGEELKVSTKPSIILVIGVNGVGKTTTIGKMAAYLQNQGKKVILGAADTFRAAAIEQLQVWADRAKCDLI